MTEKEKLVNWVRNWQETGQILEHLRREKIRRSETSAGIQALASSFRVALSKAARTDTSGLVELQDWLRKSKENG